MTRNDAKANLIALGIENPTEDAITNYLNQVNGATKKEKDRADGYKADADRAAELQKQLDDIADKDKTDLEKANQRIAELEKAQALASKRNDAMAKLNMSPEQAKQYVLDDGSLDMDYLSTFISERESASATAKEQEIAGRQGNPGGGSSSEDADPADVAMAKTLSFGSAPKKGDNIYVKH